MSFFNKKPKPKSSRVPDTTNQAGGAAYMQSPELELASWLVTSFVQDTMHESAADQIERIKGAVDNVTPLFAAQAAIYARYEFGMRTSSHLIAAMISTRVKGKSWGRGFYKKVARRIDDMAEIMTASKALHGRLASHAMRKGFADRLEAATAYELGKYKMTGKDVSLVDIVNLCHPRPTEAINALMNGKLDSPDTWEVGLSAAGSDKQDKAQVWSRLLSENKLLNCDPLIYTFDLAGGGTSQFDGHKVCQVAGFNTKVFDIMAAVERDRNALVTDIENTTF